jgi:hypothetical protein
MVLPSLDDRVGEHARTCELARDRQVERLGDEHMRFRAARSVPEHEAGRRADPRGLRLVRDEASAPA